MPAFKTPEPISFTFHIEVGAVRVIASDRADTVVEVRPRSGTDKADVQAAEQTQVDFAGGTLTVRMPKGRGMFGGSRGAVSLEVALPRGSSLSGTGELADLHCQGTTGHCAFKTGAGDIRVEEADGARLRTQHGDITVERVTSGAEVTTGSGEIRIQEIRGDAEIKNSNGNTWIDEITGELRLKIANGNTVIGRAHGPVTSKSAHGGTRIEEAMSGTIELHTKAGDLEIGIHRDSAVWLDVKSQSGTVHSTLEDSDGPGDAPRTVRVRARTTLGDILIRRA